MQKYLYTKQLDAAKTSEKNPISLQNEAKLTQVKRSCAAPNCKNMARNTYLFYLLKNYFIK